MQSSKKFISVFLLAACLLLLCPCVGAVAEAPVLTNKSALYGKIYTSGDFCYCIEDGVAIIVDYIGNDEEVRIPEELGGNWVEGLDQAFYNNKAVKKVVMSDEICFIGEGEFYGCENLEAVELSELLVTIPSYAFAYSGIKSIVIPSDAWIIQNNCFEGCKNLHTINFEYPYTIKLSENFMLNSGVRRIEFRGLLSIASLPDTVFTQPCVIWNPNAIQESIAWTGLTYGTGTISGRWLLKAIELSWPYKQLVLSAWLVVHTAAFSLVVCMLYFGTLSLLQKLGFINPSLNSVYRNYNKNCQIQLRRTASPNGQYIYTKSMLPRDVITRKITDIIRICVKAAIFVIALFMTGFSFIWWLGDKLGTDAQTRTMHFFLKDSSVGMYFSFSEVGTMELVLLTALALIALLFGLVLSVLLTFFITECIHGLLLLAHAVFHEVRGRLGLSNIRTVSQKKGGKIL